MPPSSPRALLRSPRHRTDHRQFLLNITTRRCPGELTCLTVTANLKMREIGFKALRGPRPVPPGPCPLLPHLGEWHCGSVFLDGGIAGVKNRYTPPGSRRSCCPTSRIPLRAHPGRGGAFEGDPVTAPPERFNGTGGASDETNSEEDTALAVPALAFLLQLWWGFRPYGPEPAFTMSGAASEPMVVVWISALLAALGGLEPQWSFWWPGVQFRNQRWGSGQFPEFLTPYF